MPPQEFFIRVQQGITGGFAPPTPSAIHTLTRSAPKPDTFEVTSSVRADGTPDLVTNVAGKALVVDDHKALLDELQGILTGLPTENPPGSEDIYGQDTSIAFGSSELEWMNGGPQGCGNGTSSVQASKEQKEKFKRAVEIVKHLVSEQK